MKKYEKGSGVKTRNHAILNECKEAGFADKYTTPPLRDKPREGNFYGVLLK